MNSACRPSLRFRSKLKWVDRAWVGGLHIFRRGLPLLLIGAMGLPSSVFARQSQKLHSDSAAASPDLPSVKKKKRSFDPYLYLRSKAKKEKVKNRNSGLGYVVSGGIALAISVPAYYLSEDVFAKTVFSFGQTLAVGAIGYGSYQLLVDDDYNSFLSIVEETPGLTRPQKSQLSRSFLVNRARRSKHGRIIRVIGHTLTMGLNVSNALTTESDNLKRALFFIGGINALAAISALAGSTEDEDLVESRLQDRTSLLVAPNGVGLAYRLTLPE